MHQFNLLDRIDEASLMKAIHDATGGFPGVNFQLIGPLSDPRKAPRKPGLYRITFQTRTGWRVYHGIARDLQARLLQHKTCAGRLGFSVDRHQVSIATHKHMNQSDWRSIEKSINHHMISFHKNKTTNQRQEIDDFVPPFETAQTYPQENLMHTMTCRCSKCRSTSSAEFEMLEFNVSGPAAEYTGISAEASFVARDAELPFSEAEETELAMELLSVSSEAELDQFLGKLVSGAWKGIKKVGGTLGKLAKPLGGVLKGVAKTALPFVGGALGSLIPIPGVGTALGTALGSAVSSALEAELGELESDEMEFESARRFVRIARAAARAAAQAPTSGDPNEIARAAVAQAAQRHLPHMTGAGTKRHGGRWERQGRQIMIFGA